MEYRVIGECRVADVAPGGTVSHDRLVELGANIPALLTYHLEEVKPVRHRTKKDDA